LVFNELAFNGSKIVFTTDRFTLEQIELNSPNFDILIKALLRSYEGIFDNECLINEKFLAKVCNASTTKIIQVLNQNKPHTMIHLFTPKEVVLSLLNHY
jgi:ATP-dependent DNA helicase RecQ